VPVKLKLADFIRAKIELKIHFYCFRKHPSIPTHTWSVYGNVQLALFANEWLFTGRTQPGARKLEAGNNKDYD